MVVNKQILLDSRPTGEVSPANFRFAEDGAARRRGRARSSCVNIISRSTPTCAARLNDAKSYARPQEIGAVMGGGAVGEVIEFENRKFKPRRFRRRPGRLAAIFRRATGPAGASSMRS